jgi:hypothetical protein
MKRRIRKVINFFAFNLLFFALYLNFIHRDRVSSTVTSQQQASLRPVINGTVLVQNPEKYLQQKNNIAPVVVPQQVSENGKTEATAAALKLSIN